MQLTFDPIERATHGVHPDMPALFVKPPANAAHTFLRGLFTNRAYNFSGLIRGTAFASAAPFYVPR